MSQENEGVGSGGAREGAGIKPPEPRKQLWTRLPESQVEVLDRMRGDKSQSDFIREMLEYEIGKFLVKERKNG